MPLEKKLSDGVRLKKIYIGTAKSMDKQVKPNKVKSWRRQQGSSPRITQSVGGTNTKYSNYRGKWSYGNILDNAAKTQSQKINFRVARSIDPSVGGRQKWFLCTHERACWLRVFRPDGCHIKKSNSLHRWLIDVEQLPWLKEVCMRVRKQLFN